VRVTERVMDWEMDLGWGLVMGLVTDWAKG
jgi:hypothetical protein